MAQIAEALPELDREGVERLADALDQLNEAVGLRLDSAVASGRLSVGALPALLSHQPTRVRPSAKRAFARSWLRPTGTSSVALGRPIGFVAT